MSFSISESQYQKLLTRITNLEQQANDQTTAMNQFITLSQMNQLSVLLQSLIDVLETNVEALESRVEAIENEPRL